jgi:transcriptional/translational regulatory protein YebC/TACO1
VIDAGQYDEDSLFEVAIEAGAEDVIADEDEFILTTEASDFVSVQNGIKEAGIKPTSVELTRIAKNEVAVTGRDAEKMLKLLEMLEELDDVQKVHSNADIDEDIIAEAM